MIRPTQPADVDALVALTSATDFFKPHEIVALREVLDDYFNSDVSSDHISITYDDGAIRGFAYFASEPMAVGTWLLWWIVVDPDSQRRSIGKQLMDHVESKVRKKNGRIIFIETSSQPIYESTRQFYLRIGYEQDAVLRDYYAAGDHKVVYRKALT